MSSDDERDQQHRRLVESMLAAGVIRDPRIAAAFLAVPRHEFVPPEERPVAYADRALPIGFGQTISQPSMIAVMLDALELGPNDRVLEVGAGSGYAAALLGQLCREVFAIELLEELADRARTVLWRLGVSNVVVFTGDGYQGLPQNGPYDAIVVSAAPEHVPEPLLEQLAEGGRIAIPVGGARQQVLRVGRRRSGAVEFRDDIPCLFVPLVHASG